MPIQTMEIKITGIGTLLTNNPQTVDRFHPLAKKMAKINAKKTRRTDDDYRELAQIELRAKTYFDDKIGLYVPSKWVIEAMAKQSFVVCKVSKDNLRGAVLATETKIPLQCAQRESVKSIDDIVGNPFFHNKMAIPQGKNRIVKYWPMFHNWSFETKVEFDDKIIDPDGLIRTIEHAAKYGGFGDFRPTFGRATAECNHV